ncbi:hypothetical protein O6H91_10G001700 [Diphasiastrum complanatum]|uniref:Uncharacterized protein n=1 Tax=Diphasiastrum complanatum TaxID=34168 RepID=A0ACC2CEN3_DIPCM|nr:hypothetical protein O6H91_10G001700 [Diphasiastrum complanatum]
MMKTKGMQDLHSQQEVESKIASLSKEVAKTRTWASVLKQDGNSSNQVQPSLMNSSFENVFTEHERRAKKALNIRVRGIPNGNKALDEAKDVLVSKLAHTIEGFDTAWRSKFDDKVLFLKFRSIKPRYAALRLRAKLKGTFIFMDEDLTHTMASEEIGHS